eukprot:s1999_g3.t1
MVVSIENKQDRIADIAALDEIIASKKLRPRDLPSHRARLQYADMQIAGCAGKLATHYLRQIGTTGIGRSLVDLDSSQVCVLTLLKRRVASGKPKKLTVRLLAKPWIFFTAGALEYDES